jgi:selenocysteine lyase/cysteine desulfurase
MRFEAGAPNVAGIAGLAEALAVIGEVGIDGVSSRLEELTSRLASGLEKAGMRVISPRENGSRSGIVSFDPSPRSAREVAGALRESGVAVAARRGYVRVSPHWYNSKAQVDRFLEGVRQ